MKIVTTSPAGSYALARNATTRVIHQVYGISSACGASRKNIRLTLAEAEAADESRFCDRCFAGKPELFEVEV